MLSVKFSEQLKPKIKVHVNGFMMFQKDVYQNVRYLYLKNPEKM